MKPRIWIIDSEWPNYDIENAVFAQAFADYTVRYSTPDSFREDLKDFGCRADAVLCQIDVPMDRAAIERFENCQILSNYGTGYNNIDTAAATEKGIAVGYVPGYCDEDIADYVLSALYAVKKPVFGFETAIGQGLWGAQVFRETPHRLSSLTLFLVGFGRIGAAVAKKAAAVGVRVLAWSPTLTPERAAASGAKAVSLEEGLSTADFVSLHLRYSAETERFLDQTRLSKMKPGAWLLNTARGGVLDQAALCEAVKAGKLSGAILDVLKTEPPALDDPVLHTKRIFVTPHISYDSQEALDALQRRAAENAVRVLKQIPGADLVAG